MVEGIGLYGGFYSLFVVRFLSVLIIRFTLSPFMAFIFAVAEPAGGGALSREGTGDLRRKHGSRGPTTDKGEKCPSRSGVVGCSEEMLI